MSDGRKDYDEAGCASGCRDTLAGASVLVVLVAVALVRIVQKGRRAIKKDDRYLDGVGSAIPGAGSIDELGARLLAWRREVEA